MRANHIEFLIEEPSMEAFLLAILPRLLGNKTSFVIHVHQGKMDLLKQLKARLKGYRKWLPDDFRIIVLIDRDDDDCSTLKADMENAAVTADLHTRSVGAADYRVVNAIVIEELEAWFFGAWSAVRDVYPKVPVTIPNQSQYRDSDAVKGGTWEAFERILQRAGYFSGGLRKVQAAREIGRTFEHTMCKSKSFNHFRKIILEAIEERIVNTVDPVDG